LNYTINIQDDGTIIDAISNIDKKMMTNPEKSIFPLYKGLIHCYLQLIWNAEENNIYEDCGVDAYGPNKEFIPLRENIEFNLYSNSNIIITAHAD